LFSELEFDVLQTICSIHADSEGMDRRQVCPEQVAECIGYYVDISMIHSVFNHLSVAGYIERTGLNSESSIAVTSCTSRGIGFLKTNYQLMEIRAGMANCILMHGRMLQYDFRFGE